VVQRCQEFQRRTWCWSRPARPFPAWKVSSPGPGWPQQPGGVP